MKTISHAFQTPVGYSDHTEGFTACILAVALGATIIEKHFTLDKTLPGPDQSCSSDPEEFIALTKAIKNAQMILGSEAKKPGAREIENAKVMRRSIVAAHDLPAGKVLEINDVAFKRPMNGLPADCLNLILGKQIIKPLNRDHLINLAIIGDE
jgi:sialic acid synthase SpsE